MNTLGLQIRLWSHKKIKINISSIANKKGFILNNNLDALYW